jgi:tetratricopeptide (TPR) repeat protein
MKFLQRLLSRGRIRRALRRVANAPSAGNYLGLAREYTRIGEMSEVLRICQEGLEAFPDNVDLKRLGDRARTLARESRTRELYKELREAPRPAIYRELCEMLLEAGRHDRAEECAQQWYEASADGQAQLMRARARTERFFADRRREDALVALQLLDSCEKLTPRDAEPLKLRLRLYSRVGAWAEARRVVVVLLDLAPGNPKLEARFRRLTSMAQNAVSLDQALRQVERTGQLVDDDGESENDVVKAKTVYIRPRLEAMSTEDGIKSAIYVRGSTALVQGQRGATAERQARATREIAQQSRIAARRIGLGQAFEVALEGEFGNFTVALGDLAAAALWSDKPIQAAQQRGLLEVAGLSGETEEKAA